jgi:hypothetical protein
MSLPPQRTVAISYAWKAESGGDGAGKVEEFCRHLENLDVKVLRDVKGLKLGDSLSRFMASIGTSDFVCVFLSDAYLRSPSCMYELLVAWESLRHHNEAFSQRVKIWVMADAKDVRNKEGRLARAKFWCDERDRLAPLIKAHAGDSLAPQELEAFNRVKRFADSVDQILCVGGDTLSPSFKELQEWASKEFPPLTPEEEARQLADCYLETVREVDRILEEYPSVGAWLAAASSPLVDRSGKTLRLSENARIRQFVASDHFKALKEALPKFAGTPAQWDNLRQVVGGLAVLAVNRDWVLIQRRAWRRGEPAVYPGHDGIQLLLDGRSANFLPLATAALAQGIADLGRIFGEPDPRLIDDPPEVSRGLGPDREHEYKLFFIRAVLKSDARRSFKESDVSRVDALFRDVQEALHVAAEDHSPFYGTHAAFATLRALVRDDLKLPALLLWLPSGQGAIRDVLPEPVHCFHSLHAIFSAIQRRLLAP